MDVPLDDAPPAPAAPADPESTPPAPIRVRGGGGFGRALRRFLVAATVALMVVVIWMVGHPQDYALSYRLLSRHVPGRWIPVPSHYDGRWRAWRPDGSLWFEGRFDRGMPVGTHTRFRRDGTRAEAFFFTDGKGGAPTLPRWPADWIPALEDGGKALRPKGLGGEWILYDPEGRETIYRGLFEDGLEEGHHMAYREGKLIADNAFVGGVRQGDVVSYYPDGSKVSVRPHVDGKLEGSVKTWYPNGQLMLDEEYRDNLPNGLRRQWAEDGALEMRERYLDGKLHGTSVVYGPKGVVLKREEYREGALDGPAFTFYDNGRPRSRTLFKNGAPDGLAVEWREDGTPRHAEVARDGQLDGPSIDYDDAGRPVKRMHYAKGVPQGWYQEWRGDGRAKTAMPFVRGKPEGWGVVHGEDGASASWRRYEQGRVMETVAEKPEDWVEPPAPPASAGTEAGKP